MDEKKILSKIRKILNKYDPIGIILEDENLDEYDPEIHEIIALMKNNTYLENFPEEIFKIFIKYFDLETAGNKEKYTPIAQEILKLKECKK